MSNSVFSYRFISRVQQQNFKRRAASRSRALKHAMSSFILSNIKNSPQKNIRLRRIRRRRRSIRGSTPVYNSKADNGADRTAILCSRCVLMGAFRRHNTRSFSAAAPSLVRLFRLLLPLVTHLLLIILYTKTFRFASANI